MITRRKTRTVKVGNVNIGSEYPVVIQSMTKTDTRDVSATAAQILALEDAGCELIRVAVKDSEAAKAIGAIKEKINIPLIADIHFDHRLALEAINSGVDKIRINPGNISKVEDINRVIDAASEKNIPMRIGVNSGSLTEMVNGAASEVDEMVRSLAEYLKHFKKRKFDNIILSLKSSDVNTTLEAYRKMADECDHPFHLGVTAAGTLGMGVVKSSIGMGMLILQGIGDTIRVSLTGDPVEEVITAKRILSAVGSRSFGPEIIACPTCGRCQVDLVPIVEEVEREIAKLDTNKPFIIAIMGCEVNGPGEAKNADIGIAFGKGKGSIFVRGEIVKTVDEKDAVRELLAAVKKESGDG